MSVKKILIIIGGAVLAIVAFLLGRGGPNGFGMGRGRPNTSGVSDHIGAAEVGVDNATELVDSGTELVDSISNGTTEVQGLLSRAREILRKAKERGDSHDDPGRAG